MLFEHGVCHLDGVLQVGWLYLPLFNTLDYTKKPQNIKRKLKQRDWATYEQNRHKAAGGLDSGLPKQATGPAISRPQL